MKTKFSRSWKGSKKPRKQVKYKANAPLHLKSKFLNCALSKELKQKYSKNAVRVRKGDKVTVMRGQYKKKTGKVERVLIKTLKVFVTGIEVIKKDGSKSLYPLQPSNLMITELNLDDKKRAAKLKGEKQQKTPPAPKAEKKPVKTAAPKDKETKQKSAKPVKAAPKKAKTEVKKDD